MIDRRKFIKSVSLLAGTLPFVKPMNFSKFAKQQSEKADCSFYLGLWSSCK